MRSRWPSIAPAVVTAVSGEVSCGSTSARRQCCASPLSASRSGWRGANSPASIQTPRSASSRTAASISISYTCGSSDVPTEERFYATVYQPLADDGYRAAADTAPEGEPVTCDDTLRTVEQVPLEVTEGTFANGTAEIAMLVGEDEADVVVADVVVVGIPEPVITLTTNASPEPARKGKKVTVKGIEVSPRDVVAACLPDPATIGDKMTGKTCAGVWVTGKGKDGQPRSTYLYHVVDNEDTMREYNSQAVVWQTAINPVIALELLASGVWSGTGVLGPEAFDARPFLDLLGGAYGSPWGIQEKEPA